jgi:hypothetical protein
MTTKEELRGTTRGQLRYTDEEVTALVNSEALALLARLKDSIDDGKHSHSMKVISKAITKEKERYE